MAGNYNSEDDSYQCEALDINRSLEAREILFKEKSPILQDSFIHIFSKDTKTNDINNSYGHP